MQAITSGNCAVRWRYELTCLSKNGSERWRTTEDNIVPDAGRDYFATAALLYGQQFPAFYIGLGGVGREPEYSDTASSLSEYGELTQWTSGMRVLWVPGSISGGSLTNADDPAIFISTAITPQSVRTVFIVSSQPFGSSSGLLISAAMQTSPKIVDPGETLKVVATHVTSNRV
jgi:hypothetical protein